MSIFKKKSFWIILAIIIVIVLIVIFSRGKGDKEEEYNTVIAERQDLFQTVSETGKIVSDPDIDLSFQTSGIINFIYYHIGEKANAGEIISTLESNDQSTSVAQAQANLAAAQAALNQRLAGATEEEINISKANVNIAQISLEASKNNLEIIKSSTEQTIKNAEIALEKAKINLNLINEQDLTQGIQDAYDNMFINLGSSLLTIYNGRQAADHILGIDNQILNDDFEKYLSTLSPQALNDAETFYKGSSVSYQTANDYYQSLSANASHDDINLAASYIDKAFEDIENCLAATRSTLEYSTVNYYFPETRRDSLIAGIDASRASVQTALSAFKASEQAITSALNAYAIASQDYEAALQNLETAQIEAINQVKSAELDILAKESALAAAQAELALKEADPRAVDLAGLYANINKAQASLAAANYSYRKTQITAPVEGIISKIEYDVGENIAALSKMVSMITPLPKIEVDVSETDIAKVELDDSAEITLDAYGDDIVFPGKVTFIEPAETEIAGVVYYKIKIVLEDTLKKNIKPGMTANVTITTDKKENVIAAPQRAIITKDDKKIIRVLKNGEIKEVEVQTGLRGDSNTEIISGLKKGDEVVTFIKSQ